MTRDEYYADELSYEAESDEWCERCRREEEEWDDFEDEYQANGFRDEADYNQYRYGSAKYL